MNSKQFRMFIFLCVICLLPLVTFGQSNRGRISGQVTDSTGAAIAGARVTIENLGTHVLRSLQTNSEGTYNEPNAEPGFYSVKVEAQGFKSVVRDKVQIEVGNDVKLDFQLKPGVVTEVVEVSGEAPLTEASDAVLNGVISNQAINELPLQGRDFQNLLGLHPGVQRTPGGGFHSTTSNGLRPDDNNYIIDGATDTDAYYGETVMNQAGIQGTPASTLPLDAIQEFNTEEQPQADFGAKPGVVVNIGIKSGTDQIHGTAYYFGRNDALDARNYFNVKPQPISTIQLSQFGASIGGPIIKKKWFYFANYEGVRSTVGNPYNAYSPVTSSLATADNPAGDPDSSIPDALHSLGCDVTPTNCSQLSLNLLKYLPKNPGYTASTSDPTIINFNFNNTNRADNLVFKSDYHINDKHMISGRFVYANSNQVEEDVTPIQPYWLSHASPISQVFGLDWTWTPNSRWNNTARFSLNSFNEQIAPVDASKPPSSYGLNTGITDSRLYGFPRINPSTSYFDYMGGNSSWPLRTTPSSTQSYSDTASVTFGKHTLKFGGVFSDGGVDYYRASYGRGRVDFHYLPDFLTGNVRSWRLLYGDPGRSISMKSWGLFAQDDYRVTRNVTLNLGLRYDVTYPIHDSRNMLANYVPGQGLEQVGMGISQPYQTNYNNVSPRLGVAWDLFGNSKTVVRSGFGMIYIQPSIRTFAYSGGGLNLNPSGLAKVLPNGTVLPPSGTITSYLLTGADPGLINWSVAGPIFPVNDTSLNACSFDNACTIFAVDQHLKTPYVLNWNLNIQQQITPTSVLQVAYVANHGVRLYSTIDINQSDPSLVESCYNAGGDYAACQQAAKPMVTACPPSEGGVGGGGSCLPYLGFVNYLGNKSTSTYESLQMTFTKRYSHGLYLLAGYTFGHAIDTAGNTNNIGYIPQNSLDFNSEKGSGDYDIRHRFTLSASYDLPSRKSWGQMLEGWQVNTIFMYETGMPVLLYDDYDDLTGTNEGPGNANNDRWNIQGNPNNLKWSQSAPIPFLDPSDPHCQAVAKTAALQDALNYVGGCYSQNGTTIYPNAFYTFGNMGRNILRGPGFVNWDASVAKTWMLTERFRLQFRGEIFNLLNHPNFAGGSVGEDLSSPDALGLASATPDVQAANPVVGSGGSRHIQLGLKLMW
jgi:Carboxypeptidase regulatory-like domain/TonB dependent receptor-like, beta-barrel